VTTLTEIAVVVIIPNAFSKYSQEAKKHKKPSVTNSWQSSPKCLLVRLAVN